MKAAIASCPSYSSGWGGIVSRASSEQGDHGVEVAALDGVGKAPDQPALAGGVGLRSVFAVGGRQPRPERRAGALEGALHRGLAGAEHLGDLGGAQAEHIAEDQSRALARGQVLEADDERELDRLPGLVARGRARGAVGTLSSRASG
jgi:hypothetical protein